MKSEVHYFEYSCDKCKKTVTTEVSKESPTSKVPVGFWSVGISGALNSVSTNYTMHLCPSCIEQLFKFFK